jgi:hypothetical protein
MTRYDPLFPAGRGRPHPSDNTHSNGEEAPPMVALNRYISAIHADRAARFEAEARAARIASESRARRARPERATDRRIRRAIGRSIVRVGERIAADQAVDTLRTAGSR